MSATGSALDIALSAGVRVRDYVTLLKPRVMSLVIFTSFAGVVLAPGALHPLLAGLSVLCIAIGAGPPARSTCGTTATLTH
jgi:protoheme IX farnesyltransferase